MAHDPSVEAGLNGIKGHHSSRFGMGAFLSSFFDFDEAGYSVWLFLGGRWDLIEDRCREGYEPGPPPSKPGLHEGYAIRKAGVKKPGPRPAP